MSLHGTEAGSLDLGDEFLPFVHAIIQQFQIPDMAII